MHENELQTTISRLISEYDTHVNLEEIDTRLKIYDINVETDHRNIFAAIKTLFPLLDTSETRPLDQIKTPTRNWHPVEIQWCIRPKLAKWNQKYSISALIHQ
jgi:hypothetical protein